MKTDFVYVNVIKYKENLPSSKIERIFDNRKEFMDYYNIIKKQENTSINIFFYDPRTEILPKTTPYNLNNFKEKQ